MSLKIEELQSGKPVVRERFFLRIQVILLIEARMCGVYKTGVLMGKKVTESKVDRRVKRTRRSLGEAMLALVVEKEYESITINEITQRADINRATFYLHYASKDELLMDALEERFEALVATFDSVSSDAPIWEATEIDLATFRHVAAHVDLYKVILGERGMGYIINRILDYITELSEKLLVASFPQGTEPPVPAALMARHYAGSLYALLSWWVQNDMPHPPEYMARLSGEMCRDGILNMLRGRQEERDSKTQLGEA